MGNGTGGAGLDHHHAGYNEGPHHHDAEVHLECSLAVVVDHQWGAADRHGDDPRSQGMHRDDGRRLHDDAAAVHDLDDQGRHHGDVHGTTLFRAL